MSFSRFLHEAEGAFRDAKDAIKDHIGDDDDQAHNASAHRFQSFAPQTTGHAKWFVDGASYFHAVSMALESARESIYILDWWLSPELYLRRPPSRNERYRLDNMLRAAAERGVEVRVIVYKEVTQALSCDSAHTKHALEALHPNIKVFRHPDHTPNRKEVLSSFSRLSLKQLNATSLAKASGDALEALYGSVGDSILYWAHHEKLCLVDRRIAFMGGLDLCFGRWDTSSHPIADAHPGNLDATIFPGQDYNNARIFDFEGVNNWNHNQLDRTKSARMGWSDVTLSLVGPIVGNLLDHFTDRWNFIFEEKYVKMDQDKYQALTLGGHDGSFSTHHMLGRMQGRLDRGVRHFMGEDDNDQEFAEEGAQNQREGLSIQLCRSCCPWSSGHPTEHSIANAYIDAITNAEHFVYIENQFFITATGDKQKPVTNRIGAAMVDRIARAHRDGRNFRIIVNIPAVPAFPGDLKSDGALGTRAIMEFQYNSISRGGNSIIDCLKRQGIEEWWHYIGFYNLRSYDRINISSAMGRAERDSGVSYEEARHGYDERYAGGEFQGEGGSYDRYQQAARNVEDRTWDTVSACYMDGGPDIRSVPWEGSEEDEVSAFVSEELYIHSKLLIADDRRVICGSANLNDRSQLGDHDSEIAVVIEDPEPIESTMDGRPYRASRFAASLRRHIFRKHLGLLPDQPWDRPTAAWTPVGCDPQEYDWGSHGDRLVADPLGAEFVRLWTGTARTNTEVFTKVFHPVPNDAVRNWEQYDDFFSRYFSIPGAEPSSPKGCGGEGEGADHQHRTVEYGHVVRAEFPPVDGSGAAVREIKEWLSRVRGTLVEMPLDFLVELGEDLAMEGVGLNFATKEIYT